MAVEDDTGQRLELTPQSRREIARMRGIALAFRARERGRDAEPDDLVRGRRARAQTALVSATELDRRDPGPRALAHVKRADAFRAVELVCRQAQEVDAECIYIHRQLAH